MEPHYQAIHDASMYWLFVTLPYWEEHGTVCQDCFPEGSDPGDKCTCQR